MATEKDTKTEAKLTLKLNFKTLIWVLVVTNILTLAALIYFGFIRSDNGTERTITMTGEATLEAEPDEYQFGPSWDIEGWSEDAVLTAATEKANAVVAGLKALGVEEKDIQLNAGSYQYYYWEDDDEKTHTYVYLTITLNDKDLAQQVQDYLLTTAPEGQITPWPTFSTEKAKELKVEARKLALADARAQADQAASELGLSVGDVVSVQDGYGFDMISPMYERGGAMAAEDTMSSSSMPILPGESEYSFSVTVVYEID